MSSSKITIKEVAKKAGVSIATVSRFLNNTSLRKENQKKVEMAIKELDYHPFLYARRMAGGHLGVFGLIIPGYEGIFYSFYALEIIREVAAAFNERGTDLHLNIFWNSDTFQASLVDGVIMADVIGNEKQLDRLIKEKIPLVVINKKVEDKEVSFVAIDNFKGAYEATEFLINHGHKRIVHFAGDLRVQCARERMEGYKAALKKNKIEADNSVEVTNFSRKDARLKLEAKFSSSRSAPTAIFCCSDEVASEVLSFAEEKRIRVPKDLSVIGFDDNPHCLYGNSMLTTVRQPLNKMAQMAVKVLSESLEGKESLQRIVLSTDFIIRDTVSFL